MGQLVFLDATGVLSSAQLESVQTSLTSTANGVLNTFIELMPVIAVTVGIIFAVRFIKKRFKKVENIG